MRFQGFLKLIAVAALLTWSAAAAAQVPSFPATNAGVSTSPDASPEYRIGPGDMIELRVVGQEQLSGKFRVGETGTVSLPFVGTLQAGGMTEPQLTESVREKLKKYLREPELSVTVAEFNSQFITIIGAVRTPGRYPLKRSVRILDAVGLAGGMTEQAGKNINLVRYQPPTSSAGDGKSGVRDENIHVESVNLEDMLQGRPELNRKIASGDLIYIPEADTIYVTGNVSKPGAYSPKSPVTLTQAIGLAGGMTPEARRSQISLYRAQPGTQERVELTFSLGELEKRKVKDPLLLPNDVVYIRGSESRSLAFSFVRAIAGGLGNSLGFIAIP